MLNINIGLLGHVDSGKTSLAMAISHTASTAAFDKNPQSQERGITLDLGFSACEVTEEHPRCGKLLKAAQIEAVRCTIVDCPGHGSLIRTMVGGAHITDVIILVVDATKGVQTQTAECLVLAEVLAKPLMVVVNKIDALQGHTKADKEVALTRLLRRLKATFARTRWPCVPMVCVAAAPRVTPDNTERDSAPHPETSSQRTDGCDPRPSCHDVVTTKMTHEENFPSLPSSAACRSSAPPINTESVLPTLLTLLELKRKPVAAERVAGNKSNDDFFMLVDHCFPIRGHGTVLTGTVLSGVVRVGDTVALPELSISRKVKSMQCFHRAVTDAHLGDRVGVCVTQLDHTLVERGVLCSAASLTANRSLPAALSSTPAPSALSCLTRRCFTAGMFSVLVAEMTRIRYYKGTCDSHTRFHVVLGHTTVMATMRYFSRPNTKRNSFDRNYDHGDGDGAGSDAASFVLDLWSRESDYEEELGESAVMDYENVHPDAEEAGNSGLHSLLAGQPVPLRPNARTYYAVLLLEKPLYARVGQVLLAMRLDSENEHSCRIAMAGRVRALLPLHHSADTEPSVPSTVGSGSLACALSGGPVGLTAEKQGQGSAAASSLSAAVPFWRMLPVVRHKRRILCVERVLNDRVCIASGLATMPDATNLDGAGVTAQSDPLMGKKCGAMSMAAYMHAHVQRFIGFKVTFERNMTTSTSYEHADDGDRRTPASTPGACPPDSDPGQHMRVYGVIESSFGHSGKVKIVFERAVFVDVTHAPSLSKENKKGNGEVDCNGIIAMTIKKYPFASHSRLTQ